MFPKKLKQLLLDGQRDTKCTLQPCQECIKDPCCRNPGYETFSIGRINNGITKEFTEVRETLLYHFYPNSIKRFIGKE